MKSTERFTHRADDYAASRPSYPIATIDALFDGLPPAAECTVVDLGAGTGISSRLFAARTARVIAVEPNAAMAAKGSADAAIRWQIATAEHTGLTAKSADLVTAFQAFHWFDYDAAIAEMVRLLRPGGHAAIVYNERDEHDPFTAAYGTIVRAFATEATEQCRADGRAAFERSGAWSAIRYSSTIHAQPLERTGLHARVRGTSYLPNDGPEAERLHAELDELFERFSRDECVTMMMAAAATIATPR